MRLGFGIRRNETNPVTHEEAAQIIRGAWVRVHGREASELEVLYTQAVAYLETHYGRAGQFGKLAAQGLFNWANIEKKRVGESCPEGWAPGVDQGNVCFRVFPSDDLAAEALIRTLTTRHWPTLAAMDGGTPEDMARAMRVPLAYYTGPPGTEDEKVAFYAGALRNAIRAIGGGGAVPGGGGGPAPGPGEPPLVRSPGQSGAWAFAGVAAVGITVYAIKKKWLKV